MTAVFLHGGGDSPAARSIAFGPFAQAYLSGATGPLLIVAAAASETEAREIASYYVELFAGLGIPADQLRLMLVAPDRPLTEERIAAHNPSGLFVCGGSTPLYHRALCGDLSWVAYFRERAILYGGTSAGAAIAAGPAILGGWQTDEVRPRQIVFEGAGEGLDPLTVEPGAGLVSFAVDVHAGQAGTLTRLIHTVRGGLADEGWAIDEDTLLAVHPTRIRIYGRGHAYRVLPAAQRRVTVGVFAAPATLRRR